MKDSQKRCDRRIEIVFGLFVFVMALAAARLVWLQVIKHDFFKRKAQAMHLSTEKKQYGRGGIFDRNGKVLAMSVKTESICAAPNLIRDKKKTANLLAHKLGMSYGEAYRKISGNRSFSYVERKVDPETADEILSANITGIFSQSEEKRYYPLGETAAHVIGFAGMDNKGLEGIERDMEKYLRGKTGRSVIRRDARRRAINLKPVSIKKAEEGADVYLTLDSTIQYFAEQELNNIAKRYKAKKGSVIVMEPDTGAVLALANYPSYDPNDFGAYSSAARRNTAVTDMFEPGSTFKIFTMSAFLREYKDVPDYKIHCGSGKQMFFDRYVNDHEEFGWLTLDETIKYSSNIGMVNIALRLNQSNLHREYSRFGFGKETGIEIPGEARGIFRHYRNWDNTTLTSIPYGQEIAVTAIQLAKAYSIIANGGYDVNPYLVERAERDGKVVFRNKGGRSKRIVPRDINDRLISMLAGAVEEDGTGRRAAIAGYNVAGKTGTAQKHRDDGRGYMSNAYVSSFVGFLPAENPKVLTLVVLDDPRPVYYGGEAAAPVFKKINENIISYMKITPGRGAFTVLAENKDEKRKNFEVPDMKMKRYVEMRDYLNENNIPFSRYGFGHLIIAQNPEAGSRLPYGESINIYLGDKLEEGRLRVYMPDMKGMSVRKALKVMEDMGLKVKIKGSGIAVGQDPGPGVAVAAGGECRVSFGLRGEL
ncbi:MAG TPA: PASTA domain-containing protein [Firmicutes bacterium]|nr:PASTA domain-containing protein [Bacillota bacterium]